MARGQRACGGRTGRTRQPWGAGDFPFYVIVEACGFDVNRDGEFFEDALKAAHEAGLIASAVVPKSDSDRQRIWAIRKNFEALLQLKPPFLYDVSPPPEIERMRTLERALDPKNILNPGKVID
jgi:FAD/FMN-containing dehydrogenase